MEKLEAPRRKSIVYAILTDVLFNLLVFFMLLVGTKSQELSVSQATASLVPKMEITIHGLKGQLEKTEKNLTQAHQMGARDKSIIDGQYRQIGDLQDLVGQLESENKDTLARFRSGDAVTVIVLIDVTNSMSNSIVELQSSMATLFEFMPNTSKDFQVGILAFRKGVVARYPLTPVVPTYEDGGQSQRSVLAFIESLEAKQGRTDLLPVFQEAFSMFAKAHPNPNAERKERLIFLGDTGPSEIDEENDYSPSERDIKRRILRGVTQWARQGNRAVEALYVESDWTEKDPAAEESREWFKALGAVSPQSEFYTDTSALLRAILHASRD